MVDDPKMVLQMQFETLYNKNQIVPRIKHEFSNCPDYDFLGHISYIGLDHKFGLDLLAQMALHKRCNLPTLVGILRHHFSSSQECVDAIELAARGDLIDWNPDLQIFIVIFTISKEVQEEIDIYQFPLPMVTEPREIKDNKTSGYLLSDSSVILKDNHHDDDVCLDHLNRMNRIRFSLNQEVVTKMQNEWSNLDKPKIGESKEDYTKRIRAFEKYDRTSRTVIQQLVDIGNEFHLTHKYDKRGRIYCQGYHVNYQGNTWSKAIIELSDKEIVL